MKSNLIIGRTTPTRKSLMIIYEDRRGEHLLGYMTTAGVDHLRRKLKFKKGENLVVDIGDPLNWPTERQAGVK